MRDGAEWTVKGVSEKNELIELDNYWSQRNEGKIKKSKWFLGCWLEQTNGQIVVSFAQRENRGRNKFAFLCMKKEKMRQRKRIKNLVIIKLRSFEK